MTEIRLNESDPVLTAADAEMERREAAKAPRMYLGMSGGGYCPRRQWYGWQWAGGRQIPARGLSAIDDGNRGEDVIAARIQQTPGVTLLTRDPNTGRQFEVVDAGGHVRGHMDGVLLDHPAAPKTPHVWECKVVNAKKFAEFQKIKARDGQKATLRQWDHVYWVQAQLYMLHGGYTRHWIVVASAGCRDWDAARTEFVRDEAEYFAERMRDMVANVDEMPERVAENPKSPDCMWCDFKKICHESAPVAHNCRTCVFSRPIDGPQWRCERHKKLLDAGEQAAGCGDHKLREALQ